MNGRDRGCMNWVVRGVLNNGYSWEMIWWRVELLMDVPLPQQSRVASGSCEYRRLVLGAAKADLRDQRGGHGGH